MTKPKASPPAIDTVSIDIKLKPDPKGEKTNKLRSKMKPILIKKRHEIDVFSNEFKKQAVKRKKSKTLQLVYKNSSSQKPSGKIFRHLHKQQNVELYMKSYLNLALPFFAKYLRCFRSVRSLKMIMAYGGENSKEEFKLFGGKFRHLNKIKNLEIDINNNMNSREQEIFLLCQGFKYLKSMKSLRAHFKWCREINDKAISHLGQYFKRTVLQSFFLSITRCNEIRANGLKELCDGFKGHRKLKDITFKFDECSSLGDWWFEYLQYNAQFIKNLRRINIKISKCERIRFIQVDRLNSQLRALSSKKKPKFRYKILAPGRPIPFWKVFLIVIAILAVLLGILIGIPMSVSS